MQPLIQEYGPLTEQLVVTQQFPNPPFDSDVLFLTL